MSGWPGQLRGEAGECRCGVTGMPGAGDDCGSDPARAERPVQRGSHPCQSVTLSHGCAGPSHEGHRRSWRDSEDVQDGRGRVAGYRAGTRRVVPPPSVGCLSVVIVGREERAAVSLAESVAAIKDPRERARAVNKVIDEYQVAVNEFFGHSSGDAEGPPGFWD